MKTSKPVVIFGAMMLVALQISTAWELVVKAKTLNWQHFAIDLGILYVLAVMTGAIIVDAIIYRKLNKNLNKGP